MMEVCSRTHMHVLVHTNTLYRPPRMFVILFNHVFAVGPLSVYVFSVQCLNNNSMGTTTWAEYFMAISSVYYQTLRAQPSFPYVCINQDSIALNDSSSNRP